MLWDNKYDKWFCNMCRPEPRVIPETDDQPPQETTAASPEKPRRKLLRRATGCRR